MEPLVIRSAENARFKAWSLLRQAKGIKTAGEALVSGRKIVPELWARADARCLLSAEDQAADIDAPKGLPRVSLAPNLFAELDELGTGFPLLVMALPPYPPWADEAAPGGAVMAIAAQDPVNVGAIIRSADAFGFAGVVLLREAANPFLPRATRAAAGANFRLPLFAGPPIGDLGAPWLGLDLEGTPIGEARLPSDARFLLGEEGQGLPAGFAGTRITIPIAAGAESLNVAVAAGIAGFAYRARHPLEAG